MRNLKPVLLAMLALLGIVVAGNFPPDSADALPRRINVCVNLSDFFMFYGRSCGDNYPMSWSAARPDVTFACMVKRNRRIGLTPIPPRCGRGNKRLIWGGYSETTKYLTVCVDRRSKQMFVALRGKCGSRLKIRWVKSAPYLPIAPTTTTVVESTTTSTTTTTIAPSCANGQTACALGDTGPGGGKVFYVDTANDFGWDYLEAAPRNWIDSEWLNWSCDDTSTPGGEAIGDGRSNTLSMYHNQVDCVGYSFAGRDVANLTLNGKSDWFIPSIGELEVMANLNTSLNLGLDPSWYWSSTELSINSAQAKFIDVSNGQIANATKGGLKVRPIRAFGSDCAWGGTCNIGDLGPGGGRVFFVDSLDEHESFDYMELAPSSWYGASELTGNWCSNDTITEWGATGTDIGTGQANFALMVANCTGVAEVVNDYESTYLDLSVGDWFIPSATELWTALGQLNYRGLWTGFGQTWYWSSTEYGDNARVLIPADGYHAATNKWATAGVVPVRAF